MNSGIRRYLFAGDAAISQATQVPTMEGQGDNNVLSVQTSIEKFGCWQSTLLDDNVYETYRQEVLPIVNQWRSTPEIVNFTTGVTPTYTRPATQHSGNVVFQFELNGMTNMKRIFLDYVWQISAAHFPAYSTTNTWNTAIKSRILRAGLGNYKASDLPQAEFCMLDAIQRVQFVIGQNKLIFEDGTMEQLRSRKVHMTSLNYQPQEAAQIAKLGLRYARNILQQSNNVYDRNTVPGNAPTAARPLDFQLNANNVGTWFASDTGLGSSLDPNASNFDNYINTCLADVVAERPDKQTRNWIQYADGNAPITIPLFCLVPFLAQTDTFLPKNVPIEIRIDFSFLAGDYFLIANQCLYESQIKNDGSEPNATALNNLMFDDLRLMKTLSGISFNIAPSTADGVLTSPYLFNDTINTIPSTIRILYDYYVLKENLQKEFNLTWVQQPLLYNYFKWRRYDICDNNTQPTNISYNLLINQQRPLVIYLRFEVANQSDIKINNANGVSWRLGRQQAMQNLRLQASDQQLRESMRTQVINYATGSCAGNSINLLECSIGSQLIYRADVKANNNTAMYTGHAVMDNMMQVNKDNDNNIVEFAAMQSELAYMDNACPYKIVLTQNKMYERGMFALDRGNTNLRFNIRLDEPLDTDVYTLAMYALYPAQMTIDKSYTAVESQWPVIISQNGPIVQSQYNIN